MTRRGGGAHHESINTVIKSVPKNAADMRNGTKPTARCGLVANVVECRGRLRAYHRCL